MDEEERILGHLEDLQRAIVIYCNASQAFNDENPELFYCHTLEDVDEILKLEKTPDFYQNIAIDCFFCEDLNKDIRREEGLNWGDIKVNSNIKTSMKINCTYLCID